MKIGVLALQGAFVEHISILEKLKINVVEVRTIEDLDGVNGLIIPGGESTSIGYLMKKYGLNKKIKEMCKNGLAIWGVCAGGVLIAKSTDSDFSLKLMDVRMKRNAYGRQVDSFNTKLTLDLGKKENIEGIFIRAPMVEKIGKNVKVLSCFEERPVMIVQDKLLITTFHPELTENTKVHEFFVEMVQEKQT